MAFSYGFFNSKGLDRTYTAENFCDYLGSIICNGIQDTYGQKFHLRAGSGLSVILGTGKAWIDGHYFINDAAYSIDLSSYQNESLPRIIAISIVLNTAESARNISVEITVGTPAESPTLPTFTQDADKKRLILYGVRLNAGATELTSSNISDYRDNESRCGYCRCILGKCEVTDMQYQLKLILRELQNYNEQVSELQERLTEIEEIGGATGVVLTSAGQVGDNVYYAKYSNGNLRLYGTGATYDYDLVNQGTQSVFRDDDTITSISVGSGITKIGDQIFCVLENLREVSLPDTVTEIGWTAFMQSHQYLYETHGLENITLPPNLTKLGKAAFDGNRLTEITVPKNVSEIGDYCFSDCCEMLEATVLGSVIGAFMFSRCSKLEQLHTTSRLTEIGTCAFTYCTNLTTIYFDGTVAQWNAIRKGNNWAAKSGNDVGKSGLLKIECSDGYYQFNEESSEWEEVIE